MMLQTIPAGLTWLSADSQVREATIPDELGRPFVHRFQACLLDGALTDGLALILGAIVFPCCPSCRSSLEAGAAARS